VTNNNVFWIGWLDLLIPSFTVSLNHNQLQQLTIRYCLRLAPFSFTFSFSFYDSLLIYEWPTYRISRRIHRKHIRFPPMDICEPHRKHLFLYCCNYSALHSNGSYPIVAYVFVVAEMCLPSRCPAMGLHITISNTIFKKEDIRTWTGFHWLNIRSCEQGNDYSN
jgi:hypothetical protein